MPGWQVPLVQTCVAHMSAFVHAVPTGRPQSPAEQRLFAQSELIVHAEPLGSFAPPSRRSTSVSESSRQPYTRLTFAVASASPPKPTTKVLMPFCERLSVAACTPLPLQVSVPSVTSIT